MTPKGSVLVIGTGAAGSAAATSLSRTGWKVSVVERDRVGGTCLWRGCIPKKSLYHSATVARLLRDSDRFGIDVISSNVDWQGVLAWKWHAQESYAGDQEAKLGHEGIELLRGDARFVSEEEVYVAGTVMRPDHIVLATGSRAVLLDIAGAELTDTSEDALRYASLPESLVIVGGGFIALEMAGIYASFGTEVIVVSKGRRILKMLDEELATEAATQLDALGVRFITGASVDSIQGEPGSLKVKVVDSDDGTSATLPAERVLQAIGRVPALEGLALEAAGVAVDEHGKLVLDAYLRTTNPGSGQRVTRPVA
jgi:glutathione reductase (NADPH)